MNKQDELNKKLFNRLFLKMPTVRRLKVPINQVGKIKLDKNIRYIYYSKENKMWFAHSENKTKFFYFIGHHHGHITQLNSVTNSLLIDFDKNNNMNNHSLGIINDSNMSVHLNKEILEEKYPNNNFNSFNEHIFNIFERSVKIEINTIELGKIYGTFYENLTKLLEELPLNTPSKPHQASNDKNTKSQEMNLFLNAIKSEKSYEHALQIANISSSKVKYWYNYGRKGNEEYKEFYETYKEIMPRNDETCKKMKIVIDSLNSGKTEEEALALAGASSSEMKRWIKKGGNGDLEFIDFYEDYSQINKKTENEAKTKTKQKNNELIESYINLINEGKTNKEAIEILNIPIFKIKNWRQQGQLGNKDYEEFYEAYQKGIELEKSQMALTSKKEDQKLIKEYIKLINEGKTNKEAFETLNIPRYKTKNWKQQGQLGNKDYEEFYETYLIAVKREEIKKANKFIELINEGKSNEDAMRIIRMPEFKIKQWFNKGKNGDKDFVDFYNAYMKQYDDESEIENIPKETIKPPVKEIESENKKFCEICGRSMNEKDHNTICKRCRRKQRCANIVQQLLQSIEPEVPFKKEDLKMLDLTTIQIQDYIWTLQEFNLINKEKNNKLSLVKKEILYNFIEESGVEIIEKPTSGVKLTKKCDTCGETLEISKFPVSENSPDGYENNCKTCKKLITTATYLKEILEFIEYDQEFSEDDLASYIKDPFLRQAKVWSLLENDLVIRDYENNKLKLANEKTCNEFLDKYYTESSATQKPDIDEADEPKKPEIPASQPDTLDKGQQMEIVLQARREGKSRKEAAALAGISVYKITHWHKEGRDGFGEDNIHFYNELKEIETNLLKKLKKEMNTVLKVLKKGGSVSEAIQKAPITQEELDNWIKKGKNDVKPYKSFVKEYSKYVEQSNDYDSENNAAGRKTFLKHIREGKTRKESAKKASMELKLLDSWIIKGKKGEKPYDEFYIEYKKARENTKTEPNSKEEKIKNEFIELMGQGYTLGEAAKLIENGAYAVEIKKWYVAGKQGVSKHLKFYVKCQEARNKFKTKQNKIFTFISDGFTIKEACEKLKLDPVKIKQEFLKGKAGKIPQNEFYNKLIESKTSLIDIKPLFKYPEHPHKDQMIDVLDLLLIGESEEKALKMANVDEVTFKYWINRGKQNFGELYKEFYYIYTQIKSGELIKKFRNDIEKEIEKELDEIENENADILALLPKQLRNELNNLSKEDLTGFAWVSKTKTLWMYSKRVNGRTIKITDTNIYNLHKKVIKNNYPWGVRNLEKAKQTLNLANEENNDETNPKQDILSPLPEHVKTKFSKGTKTGFAWVNKAGKYYYYIRSNKNIRIKASSVEELYQEVIDKNLDWGVLDINKAKKTLNDENYTPKDIEKPKPTNTNILAPLPEEIEKELQKYSKGSKTGFAWVGKTGKKYSYERVVNGNFISIRETSIEELHKQVLKRNLTWGVRDLEKAKKTLNEPVEETIKPKKIIKPENLSKNIYTPFPEEFEEFFKSNPTNKSGIAWVSKIGNRWFYSRQIEGKTLEISDNNIFKLHKKVINANQLWGIRDYEKAKMALITKPIDDEDYILKKIPENEYNDYPSNTGFAMVNKIGDRWEYARNYNGKKISDGNIFGLYEQILDKQLLWGVIDLEKALKSIEVKNMPEELIKNEPNKNKDLKINYEDSINTADKEEKISTYILAPLPDYLAKEFKAGSSDPTGFAWVRKYGSNWYYIRNVNNEQINIKAYDLRTLHEKVINQNLHWGVRDFKKAKKSLYGEDKKVEKITDNESQDGENEIISQLPDNRQINEIMLPLEYRLKKEYEQDFLDNKTGFAWVKHANNQWIYQRTLYGNSINLKYSDFFKLYESIKSNNYDWGVINSNKAKLTIAEVLGLDENSFDTFEDLESNENILKPLPLEIKQKLKSNSKGNSSGFAWVSKNGNNWQYTRVIDGKPIAFKDPDIFSLHKIVVNNGHLWGVRDLSKAKQTLKECDKKLPEPPKIEKMPKKTVQKSLDSPNNNINSDILAPLAPEYEESFKSSPINKTGIAWVNKIGNNWIYSRQVNGNNITIKDNDIYQLHKKVLEEGLPWGIRDSSKAKEIIFNAQPSSENTKTTPPKEQSTVFVTFNGNIASIEGKIKNNEVLKVLTRIYEFGDNILKLNTQKNDNETTLSIELTLDESQKIEFKDKIKDFGWEIIN